MMNDEEHKKKKSPRKSGARTHVSKKVFSESFFRSRMLYRLSWRGCWCMALMKDYNMLVIYVSDCAIVFVSGGVSVCCEGD